VPDGPPDDMLQYCLSVQAEGGRFDQGIRLGTSNLAQSVARFPGNAPRGGHADSCACNNMVARATIWRYTFGVSKRADMARNLQASIQAFVRSFGLLVTKQTPCGQPMSPSVAHALMVLLERELDGLSTFQHELAELLGLDRSSVQRLCSRLEADGRIKQAPAPDDARSRRIQLTPSGQRLAANIQAASLHRFTRIVDAIPASKRQPLLDALKVLTAAVLTLETEP